MFVINFICQSTFFAAVVSDNDGSAFITKAEFDSLKNNFQTQLDSYNTSIDSKIDNAIASYLAGISAEQTIAFNGFIETKGTNDYIYSRKSNYDGITKQMWNIINYVFIEWGFNSTYSGNINLYPFWNKTYTGITYYNNYVLHCQNLNALYSYDVYGYSFDENGVVRNKYKTDNINIVANHFGAGDMGGAGNYAWHYPISMFNRSERKINTRYTDFTNGTYRYWRAAAVDRATIKANIANILPDNGRTTGSTSWWNQQYIGGYLSDTYDEDWTFYHMVGESDSTRNIYSYCDVPIYAYLEGETVLETFSDPLRNSSILNPDTGLIYDFDISNKSFDNQLCTLASDNTTDYRALAIGQDKWNSEGATSDIYRSRIMEFMPKIKLKNTTDNNAYKPIINGYNESTPKFNNLYQFKNGLMPYRDEHNQTNYPFYYGGVPLFNRNEDDGTVKFKIKFSGDSGKRIMMYVKKFEFPNAEFNPSSPSTFWNQTDPRSGNKYIDDVVVIKTDILKTNTEKYVVVDLNTETTVTIENIKKDVPYFLSFQQVDGSTLEGYGGVITYLSDFYITKKI